MNRLKWWHVALGAVALLFLTGKKERETDPRPGCEPPEPSTGYDLPDYEKYPSYGYAPGTPGWLASQ